MSLDCRRRFPRGRVAHGRRRAALAVEPLERRVLLSGGGGDAGEYLPLPTASVPISFAVNAMVADPARNLVYVNAGSRLLAVDTDLGRTVAHRLISPGGSGMAVSLGGDRIFVNYPAQQRIEVYALPEFEHQRTLNVTRRLTVSIAHGVNDQLYGFIESELAELAVRIDAQTGAAAQTFGRFQGYWGGLARTSADGTRLYARTRVGSGSAPIDEFNITATTGIPPLVRAHPSIVANGKDLAVDVAARQIYQADGGIYGVGVIHMDAGTLTTWPFGAPYGTAVGVHPGSPYVYGTSGSASDAVLRVFRQIDGSVAHTYNVAGSKPQDESLKVTANDHLLVAFDEGPGGSIARRLRIFGTPTLQVEGLPVARFAATPMGGGQFRFDATTSAAWTSTDPLAEYAWDFGDGATRSGSIVHHTFAAAGSFDVRLTVTTGQGHGDDVVRLVSVDLTPPAVTGASFEFDAPRQALRFAFSEDVGASVSADDLVLTNLTSGLVLEPANVSVTYDPASATARFRFPGLTHGALPDGHYRARLPADRITDAGGNPLAGDYVVEFAFLNGDANRDGRVNLQDFNILAAHFGQTNRTFSQGDFNYDTRVNLQDFNVLADRFGMSVARPASGPSLEPVDDDGDDDLSL